MVGGMEHSGGIRRRDFIGTGMVAAGALAFGPAFWRQALAAAPTRIGPGPYGPLQPADGNGLMLPKGFSSRVIARANLPVENTTYRWPFFPDGKASYAAPDGGWIVVVNSESRPPDAGSSAIRFDRTGRIVDAYRILGNTQGNCAGGPTPWGTWLSCEEVDGGQVWECDPSRPGQGVIRPAMGTFNHEAVAVDPVGKRLYLTEDKSDGGFYRFTPRSYPDLREGVLEAALVDDAGRTRWAEIRDPAAITATTRTQVAGMRKFAGGEGIWFDSGFVYFATKGDNRIYAYDTVASVLTVVYDRQAFAGGGPLSGLDNVTVSPSGDLFVCEDGGDLDMGLVSREGEVTRFFKLTGQPAETTEIAGVIFDPSGRRLYFSSQRALGAGITYEVTGPFRTERPPGTGGPAGVAGPPAPEVAAGTTAPARPGGTTGEDVDAPGLRIRAPRRISLAELRREGLPVSIELGQVSSVAVALRTNDLARVPGTRGSVDRPVPVVLARRSRRTAPRGRLTVPLRIDSRTAARLRRRRSVRARITVQARGADGLTRIATRLVRIRITPTR